VKEAVYQPITVKRYMSPSIYFYQQLVHML